MDIARLSLRELVEQQQHGALTSEAIARDCLARAAALDPKIHAFAWLDRDAVLAQARAADRHRAAGDAQGRASPGPRGTRDWPAGRRLGLLHGIPVGIKDIIATRGIPTRMGSPVFADNVPSKSAAVVSRVEDEGGFVFGKTVTAELAYYHPGETANPWNPAHTPGGSSMGSAAAVAAGIVPAALGTQTNGSVIRPAAFCGCVGFKPSHGLIVNHGIQPFAPTLDQVGVFARHIDDAARMTAALSAAGGDAQGRASPGPRGTRAWPAGDTALARELVERKPLFQAPRLAAVHSPVWSLAEAPQRELQERVIERLRAAGAAIEEQELPAMFATAHETHRTIMQCEGARTFAALQAAHRAQLSAALNHLIDEGAKISDAVYRDALEQRERLHGELAHWFQRFDAVITPPARGEAPATREHTGDPAFCTIWTLVGVPAITLPAGRGPHGLPLGLQIVGPYRQDARTLAVAQWCADVIDYRADFPR
jgi:Asp-tRNA(Asn)/Glu-tRNA(Gln) amidotransferase A subunit family amidase